VTGRDARVSDNHYNGPRRVTEILGKFIYYWGTELLFKLK